MTAWWCYQEREVQRNINIGWISFSKQWTSQRQKNTYNSQRKYGRPKITPPPLRKEKEFKSRRTTNSHSQTWKWVGPQRGTCNLACLGNEDSNWNMSVKKVPTHPVTYARSRKKSWTALLNKPHKKPQFIMRGQTKSTPTMWTLSARRALYLLISWQWVIYGVSRMINWIWKNNQTSTKRKTEMSTFVLPNHVIFLCLSTGWSTG